MKEQYIPAPLKSAVKGGYVTDTSELLDKQKGKRQNVINQETDNEISGIKGGSTKSIADLSEDIANEAERASGVEAGLRESINELGHIGLNPENAISTDGDDFDGDTTVKRSKIPTIGAIIDGNPGVYDVSKRNPTGGPNSDGKFTLEYILANADTLIPTSRRHGGMEICFVHSSDNKYVQYRYTGTAVTGTPNPFLDTTNWQGVDDVPTAGSKNLVESGGVFKNIVPKNTFLFLNDYVFETGITVKVGKSYTIYVLPDTIIPIGGIKAYRDSHSSESDAFIITETNHIYTFTPVNVNAQLKFSYVSGKILRLHVYVFENSSLSVNTNLSESLVDVYDKMETDEDKLNKAVLYERQSLTTEQKTQARTNIGIDYVKVNIVAENSNNVPSGDAVFKAINTKTTDFIENTYENEYWIQANLPVKQGHPYYFYIFDDSAIPADGVKVYRSGSSSADDAIVMTELNTIYTFTPLANGYANFGNSVKITKLHIAMLDSNSVNKELLEQIVPIYTRLKADETKLGKTLLYDIQELTNPQKAQARSNIGLGNPLIRLSLSTWNIGYWNNGVSPYGVPDDDVSTFLPRVKNILTKACSDVMVITEYVTYFDRSQSMTSYDTLFKQFYPYQYSYESRDNITKIFSKYPVSGRRIDIGNSDIGGSFYASEVTIKIDGVPVRITGLHLEAGSTAEKITRRTALHNSFISMNANNPYVISIGDFNMENVSEIAGYSTNGWNVANGGYWGLLNTYLTSTAYLDNVCVKGLNIDNFTVITEDSAAGVSDHYPVKCEISFGI